MHSFKISILLVFLGIATLSSHEVIPLPSPISTPETSQPAPATPVEIQGVSTRIAPVVGIVIEPVAQDILNRTNQARKKAGLKPLRVSPGLQKSAQAKLDDMLKYNYFSHDKYVEFISQYADYVGMGENLARNFKTNQETFDAWMASPTHKANILEKRYTHIGIAVSGSYVVQHFGGN